MNIDLIKVSFDHSSAVLLIKSALWIELIANVMNYGKTRPHGYDRMSLQYMCISKGMLNNSATEQPKIGHECQDTTFMKHIPDFR